MSEFEKELVTLIRFKPNDYHDRQDYLAALARAADKWFAVKDKDQAIFDGLEDGLAGWFEEAITAMNHKDTIPEFPDRELEEPMTAPDEEEEAENADNEAEPVPTEGGDAATAAVDEGKAADPVAPKPKTKKEKSPPSRYDTISGIKDRFGVVVGTKTHDAVLMYERGTTVRELAATIGGKHYNILNRLKKLGHTVVPRPEGGFKLTHRDDVEKGKKDEEEQGD